MADSQPSELELRQRFVDPPADCGPVDCWWWEAGELDRDRMRWQLEEMKRKGISGTWYYPRLFGGHPLQGEPDYWSDEWWEMYRYSLRGPDHRLAGTRGRLDPHRDGEPAPRPGLPRPARRRALDRVPAGALRATPAGHIRSTLQAYSQGRLTLSESEGTNRRGAVIEPATPVRAAELVVMGEVERAVVAIGVGGNRVSRRDGAAPVGSRRGGALAGGSGTR